MWLPACFDAGWPQALILHIGWPLQCLILCVQPMCHLGRSDRSQFVNRSAQEHLMCPEPKLDWCVMIVMDHADFAIANFRQTSLRLHVNLTNAFGRPFSTVWYMEFTTSVFPKRMHGFKDPTCIFFLSCVNFLSSFALSHSKSLARWQVHTGEGESGFGGFNQSKLQHWADLGHIPHDIFTCSLVCFLIQTHLAFQALVTAVLLERPDDPSFFMLRRWRGWLEWWTCDIVTCCDSFLLRGAVVNCSEL